MSARSKLVVKTAYVRTGLCTKYKQASAHWKYWGTYANDAQFGWALAVVQVPAGSGTPLTYRYLHLECVSESIHSPSSCWLQPLNAMYELVYRGASSFYTAQDEAQAMAWASVNLFVNNEPTKRGNPKRAAKMPAARHSDTSTAFYRTLPQSMTRHRGVHKAAKCW